MTPIDDELRAALHGRASAIVPSPDPLAGIERRAKRIQRNRIGAAVAASALAVSAIAVAVPALQSATSSAPTVPNFAVTPSAEPEPTASPYALNPLDPWEYRGADLELLGPGTLDTIEREFGIRHGSNDVELTPLFGQVWEPSRKFELFFLADVTMPDGVQQYFWGISETPNDGGPEFLVDEALPEPVTALSAALAGDEGGRLVAVAAPDVGGLNYSPDGTAEAVSAMQELFPGVATVYIGAGSPNDYLSVVDRSGEEIHRSNVADVVASEQPSGEPETALDPENPWEVRGDRSLVTDGQLEALGEDWATRNGISALVEIEPLYVQRAESDAGVEVVYLVRSGDGPWTWGVAALGEGGWWWYAENEITSPLTALVAALPDSGDQGAERVLVVAAPSTGGGVYAENGADFDPMLDLAPGVFGRSISPGDPDDVVMVLDGNGDLDDPVFRGPVPDFQNAG